MMADTLLTEERRARMAAERLLAQKEAELHAANRMLSRHALSLSEEVVEKREEVAEVKGENTRVRADLERANTEIDIAKRRLWNSIQSIEDGFAVFDADSRMVIANSAYLRPFDGLECIRPGAHYQEIVEAALAEGVVDIEGLSPGQWREEMLARWFSQGPEPRVIRLWDGTWIRLVDQRAPGGDTVCLGLNITDAMKREAALNEARQRAEVANRAKSAFLANMSHEIRTPMNGVVGMADLLAEGPLDDEQRLYVDTIRTSGQSLLTIINDVLDYSKIEAGKLSLHPEPFDLERVILEVIQLMEPTIRGKGLKIMLDYDMFLPTRFEGDPVRVRQVLTNLVGNAVKFTESGHVLVRAVGLPRGEDAPQRVHLTVEDTGIGIPAEKLDHVFGEFNQVEDERNRAYEGTGLGLSITRELVELMGGKIWVESEAGVGSAFGVQLPLKTLGPHSLPHLPGWLKRVLLVMDDDLSRAIFEKRLAALGLAVTSLASADAATAEAALAADVIVADHRLSDMGAAAFLAVLRALGATAPLVLVTTPVDGHPQNAAGAAAMLAKPVSRPDLVATLSGLEPPAPLVLTDPVAVPSPPPVAEREAPAPDPRPEPDCNAEADSEDASETVALFGSRRAPLVFPVETPQPDPEAPAPVFGSRRAFPAVAPAPDQPGDDPAQASLHETGGAPNPEAALAKEPAVSGPDQTEIAPAAPAPIVADTGFPTTPDPALRAMRVLAAEDNKTNQLVFSKLVKACDIALTFAANGAEAVAAFERDVPDLIFMDISMPGMDGKEATRRIREIEAAQGLARTRIVALTAHAMAGDAEEILAHGLDAHLTKPFKKPAILAEIDAACPHEARPPLPDPA